VHAWKSYAGLVANRALGRTGRFWQPDYYDRYVRDRSHFDRAVMYIHENPVKAGLVAAASAWPFSSARR
jgi:REP element-mobilizing transposase RayT